MGYLAYTSILLFIIKESQDRNSSRSGTDAEAMKDAAYCLAPGVLGSLLS